jgi:ribosomal protein L11 methyltransferase
VDGSLDEGPWQEAAWWTVGIDCRTALAKAALWRLSGPGHRCCVVQHDDERTNIQAFLSRASVPLQEIAEFYVGLHLDAGARELPTPRVEWREVETWEWPESHKRLFQPLPVGRRLLIQPHWAAPDASGRVAVRLDSHYGFGVGTHPTTFMSLEALERQLEGSPNLTIADIGCGCGVQTVAALLLGARHVYAVDTKSASVLGTIKNRDLNGIADHRLTAVQGSITQLQQMLPRPVDGFVCNILTRVILGLTPRFASISGEHAWGILSGIREGELPALGGPLKRHGWKTTNVARQDGWCCVEIRREDKQTRT